MGHLGRREMYASERVRMRRVRSRLTPVRHALGQFEALYSNRKIREVLGFKEQHNWRMYVADPAAD